MKAILLDHFVNTYDELQVKDVPAPERGEGEVRIRITHAGVNYADLLFVRGKHQNNRYVKPPFIAGLEYSGVIESASPESEFKKGDLVHGTGEAASCFAEEICLPEKRVRRVPKGWSARDACGLAGTAPVGYGALIQLAKLQRGETVLVHAAAGGLGIMACQVAKALECTVIGTIGTPSKAKVLKRFGVDHVVDYTKDKWEDEVLALTDGRGVDVTYDPVGLIQKSIRCSAFGARLTVIGFAGREGNLESVPVNRILLKCVKVMGYRVEENSRHHPEEAEELWRGLEAMIARGEIKPVVYDEEQFKGLESVPKALHAFAARRIWGKAVIEVARPGPPSLSANL